MANLISIKQTGDWKKTISFLTRQKAKNYTAILESYGRKGVAALSSVTPVNTGLTANSWDYKVENNKGNYRIIWTNSNVVNGVPIAIILQYGHATKNGGFVEGKDYINPAIQPVMDEIQNRLFEAVRE